MLVIIVSYLTKMFARTEQMLMSVCVSYIVLNYNLLWKESSFEVIIPLQKPLLYCYALSHVVFTHFKYKHLQRKDHHKLP